MTASDLVGAQCRAVVGLGRAKDDNWRSGKHMAGVWFSSVEDAGAHQAAMHCVEDGRYEALAVSPLASGRLDPPDIVLFYATPGAMMYFITGFSGPVTKTLSGGLLGKARAQTAGAGLSRNDSLPCRSRALPSDVMVACSMTKC